MLSTGSWHGQTIPMVDIVTLLEDEPLCLDPGLQYDVEGMELPSSIRDRPADIRYLWLKWHLYEEAIQFRHHLWDAEAMNDQVLFQYTLEEWHKTKDQIINMIHIGDYRTNTYYHLQNVHVPDIPFPPNVRGQQTPDRDILSETQLDNRLHLIDDWPTPDPSSSRNG